MNSITARLICVVLGYAFGLIQTSYILGKRQGFDIRTKGSGNAGTTNAIRVMGKKAGLITVIGDIMKCIIAVLIAWALFHNLFPEMMPLLKLFTAAGVILGHNFPFYMNFRGGKGVAASGGFALAFGDWRLAVLAFGLLITCLLITKYMSLGSLSAYTGFLIGMIIFGQMGDYGMAQPLLNEMYAVTFLLTVMVYVKHRGNIVRLIQGKERKTYIIGKPKE